MQRIIQLLFVFFYTLTTNVLSQNTSYIISDSYPIETNDGYMPNEGNLYISPNSDRIAIYDKKTIVDYFSDGGNVFSIDGKNIAIYDKNTLKHKKNILITNLPEKQKRIGCVKFQEEYIMFFSSILKENPETLKCYFRKLNIETGELGNEEFILGAKNTRFDGYKNGIPNTTLFPMPEIKLSQDSSKLLFSCHQQFSVYEKGMKLSWKTDNIYGEYTPSKFYDLQDGMLGNNGTYYAILKVFKNTDPKNSDDPFRELDINNNHNYDILALKINSEGVLIIPTKALEKKLVHSLTIHSDLNNKVSCVGLYFNKANLEYSLGFFSFSLEETASSIVYYPIPIEVPIFSSKYTMFGTSTYTLIKEKDKNKIPVEEKGIHYLNGLEIHNTKDGNLLLITEQHIGFNPTREQRGGIGNYAHILVTKVNINGDIIWIKRLPKFQISNVSTTSAEAYGCGSYKYFYLNDKYYLIYLDDKNNTELNLNANGQYCESCRNGNIFAYVLDDNGNVAKNLIFDFNKFSSNTQYDYKHHMKVISDTEFLFHIFKDKKTYEIVKIKVD